MTIPRAQALIDSYKTNTWLIHHHIDGVPDEDSLLQPPLEANCLNWIIGHVVSRRNSVLEVLGLPPLWDEETAAKYKTDSEPIKSAAGARLFSALVADLDQSQEMITNTLTEASDDLLNKVVVNDRGEKTVAQNLEGFHWHETYHLGQLDILRALIQSQQ